MARLPTVTTAGDAAVPTAAGVGPDPAAPGAHDGFTVRLDVFEGPFDLLLGLISRRRLDVTAVALAQVTDDFLSWIDRRDGWDLDVASEFLVVAATLLDLKVSRLLPGARVEDDDDDLAVLEARDLLLARLLQYRAYKDVASQLAARFAAAAGVVGRSVSLEPRFADLQPEVRLSVGPAGLAALAARASRPRPTPVVDVAHVHASPVSVREQAAWLATRLRSVGVATFRSLVADCPDTMHVVARFLAVLELYREGAVAVEQVDALGELHVRWSVSAPVADVMAAVGTPTADAPADTAPAGPPVEVEIEVEEEST